MVKIEKRPGSGTSAWRGADRRPDDGQAVLEGTISLLLVTAAAVGILTLVLAAFSINSVNAAIQAASWDVTPSAMAQASNTKARNAVVRDAMLSRTPGLNATDLKVTKAKITSTPSNKSSTVTRNKTSLGISTIEESKQVARIEFDVTYNVPGFSGLKVTRHVSHDLVDNVQSEVR